MFATILVLLVVCGIVALTIRSMVKNKKEGKSACGCGCSACAMSKVCREHK